MVQAKKAKAATKGAAEATKDTTKKVTTEAVVEPAIIVAAKSASAVRGFVDFVRQQGVVGLAVGLAVGTAAGAAVKQIVDGFINPIVGFLIGGIDLAALKWVIVKPRHDNPHSGLVVEWGAILSAVITLFATALVIYWLVHVFRLDRLDKKKS